MEIVERDTGLSIFDVVFRFFCDLPDLVSRPHIRDRADRTTFIDSYVKEFTVEQHRIVREARDFFLIQLEDVSEQSKISDLVKGGFYTRACEGEKYLFDERIPVLTEKDAELNIRAYVLPKDGFRAFYLDKAGIINVDRKITFSAEFYAPTYDADMLKWKVKNDNASPRPRGEITDHRTRNNPESTKFKGAHFAECYALRNKVCVAKARQNVVLKSI